MEPRVRRTCSGLCCACLLVTLGLGISLRPAAAQTTSPPEVVLPDLKPRVPETEAQAGQSELDIASAVISAAKGVTTVQEAPSIITIITADEIRSRGFRFIGQVLTTVPGYYHIEAVGNQVESPLVRGTQQAALYLRDGVSLFDPVLNIPVLSRAVPLETIKRVEVVTGPGGVLWGANSFLGVINIITKDAEDVNGLELSAGYGTGPGDPNAVRAYALFGKTFFKDRLKVLLHASFESFLGPQYTRPALLAGSPAPQPAGPIFFGLTPAQTANDRSWFVDLDGKINWGPLTLYFQVPFGTINKSLGFSSNAVSADPIPGTQTIDPLSRRNPWNFYDRYVVLEYRRRFANDRVGINAKGFYINLNRDLAPRVFASSPAIPRGLTFQVTDFDVQRFGATFDVDYSGPFRWNRILAGVEAFNESTSQAQTTFLAPAPERLPLVCPRTETSVVPGCPLPFLFAADRTVVGLFFADQIRLRDRLIIDGGVRYQQGFGLRHYAPPRLLQEALRPIGSYPAQVLGQGSLVVQLHPGYHLKLTWSQGFRPPVFNNLVANGGAVAFAGNPNLAVERSQAFQGELNARVLRGVRNIRELQLRLDYSYTLLDNVIVVQNSRYQNAGARSLHSVEFLGKLYLTGEHAITLGYTFLTGRSRDSGRLRNFPNHWFTIGAVFNVITGRLDVNANLNVFGSFEDPNIYPTNRFTLPGGQQVTVGRFTDLTLDRLPAAAVLQLGARAQIIKQHLSGSVQLYNVLNQRYYYPDGFYDLTPTIDTQPTPAPGFSMFVSLIYRP